ncbi:hypothetical protein M9Y10_044249 [Tritrichomonas musculus]|uniref:Uncharacterized protein n=1 Tax=Tritrichomonas musculus TaxID=1915356 RepID=A0ABR2K1X6_9EUKA
MQQQTSILGPVQPRRVLTKLIDPKSTTSAPLALSGSHISVPSPPATSQSGDPMDHLEDFTQPKKAEEFKTSSVKYDNTKNEESNYLENSQDQDPFLDALLSAPDQNQQQDSQKSQHLPSDSDAEEIEPAK